jgi:protein SCO1/2
MLRDKPIEAQGIGVDQQIGKTVPLELNFYDEQNRFVALGDYFDGRRPVVVSFNYSSCPQLCVVQLNGLVSAMFEMDLVPGRDFQIVSISFDPRDKPAVAYETKAKYLSAYGRLETADGWHFLVGNEAAIKSAADRFGIRYKYIAEQDSFSHPAAFIFCSPQGQIIRYLDGLDGELRAKLKPALIEAGEGRIGSWFDKGLYFSSCYVYDPVSGKYTLVARRIMMWSSGLTVVLLLVGLAPYWFWRRKSLPPAEGETNSLPSIPAAPQSF